MFSIPKLLFTNLTFQKELWNQVQGPSIEAVALAESRHIHRSRNEPSTKPKKNTNDFIIVNPHPQRHSIKVRKYFCISMTNSKSLVNSPKWE